MAFNAGVGCINARGQSGLQQRLIADDRNVSAPQIWAIIHFLFGVLTMARKRHSDDG